MNSPKAPYAFIFAQFKQMNGTSITPFRTRKLFNAALKRVINNPEVLSYIVYTPSEQGDRNLTWKPSDESHI